jgi:hypothetical protein
VGKVARSGALVVSLTLASALAPVLGTPARADVVRDREWALRAMHGPQAWKYAKGDGVTVAVLDTGVYPGNPDLTGRVTSGPDYTHSGRHHGSPYWGRHGTAMASIIVGHGHGAGGADGVMGIAPGARILSIRVTLEASDPLRGNKTALNRTRYALANGIRYAADHGAKVISMSLGGGTPYYDGSQTERDAIAYATRKGAVLIASAGNDGAHGNRRTFPAAYTGVIAVGAVGKKLRRAPFSNSQRYVKVLAPGVNIVTAGGRHGYASTTGTSASTAFVAGTAALVRSRYKRMSAKVVGQALEQGVGSGDTLDARRALVAAARLKRATGGGTTPSPMATDKPTASGKTDSSQTLLYAGIGGGALLLAIIAAVIVVSTRRRRRAEAAQAEANDRVSRSRRPDLGTVPPVSSRGRMPDRRGPNPADQRPGAPLADHRSGSHLAAFAAAHPEPTNGNGNGHAPIQALHPFPQGPAAPSDPTPLNPYSDVHPAAETETFGAIPGSTPPPTPPTPPAAPPASPTDAPPSPYDPPPPYDAGPPPYEPTPPSSYDAAPSPYDPAPPYDPAGSGPQAPYTPYEPGAQDPYGSGPQTPYGTGDSGPQAPYAGSGPQAVYGSGPQHAYGADSGPQVPYGAGDSGPQHPYGADSGPQAPYGTSGPMRQMEPPPPLPDPDSAEPPPPRPHPTTAPMSAPPAPPRADPPPPTVETPEPPRTSPPAYGGDTPARPYQSSGSVWDTPKLWQGADTSATAPFEAEARSDSTRRDPAADRGTTGWATAAGWDATHRPSDAKPGDPTDGDDEDDRHL